MLKACPGYQFDESQDYHLLGWTLDYCPDIDVLAETKKKIKWWKDNPGALAGRKGKSPRVQLEEFFEREQKYQKFKKTQADSRRQEEYF
jgi:hypothetical protein